MNSDVCIQKFIADFSFRLTGGTLRVYQIAVEQMLAFCGKPFDAITKKDIRSWLNSLDKSGYKSSTLRNKLFGLNLFYKYCLEEEIMTYNPVASITFPDLEEGIPHYLELSQLTQLRELVKGSLQERAIIETLYATGVRIQELVDIKMEDIDWSERIIHIPNGKRKKGRIVAFTRPCKEHMKAYLPERNDELPFFFKITPRQIKLPNVRLT
ncbi:tyrosine-type recombinase/integrase [Cytobacillus sp. Bac17]|uniref:tyrosine-type recombinase/integrase n=1 Tax=Cytobacillus sp. Bac17 TaxID=2926008 RepID=UPI002119491A|nr:tyrosine-type recombinase/integrase [Cytobacillus sp. Bac17]